MPTAPKVTKSPTIGANPRMRPINAVPRDRTTSPPAGGAVTGVPGRSRENVTNLMAIEPDTKTKTFSEEQKRRPEKLKINSKTGKPFGHPHATKQKDGTWVSRSGKVIGGGKGKPFNPRMRPTPIIGRPGRGGFIPGGQMPRDRSLGGFGFNPGMQPMPVYQQIGGPVGNLGGYGSNPGSAFAAASGGITTDV